MCRKGYKHSGETKRKIGLANKGRKANSTAFKKGHKPYVMEKAENGNWADGASRKGYGLDWTKTLKRSIRERDNYVCQECSGLQEDVAHDVHHIDYDKKNCNPDNLVTLCRSCHIKTNKNRKYWVEYFKVIRKL
jgi:hypothetical protein